MNWWGCTHKNYILTNTVHFFWKSSSWLYYNNTWWSCFGDEKNHGRASLMYTNHLYVNVQSHRLTHVSLVCPGLRRGPVQAACTTRTRTSAQSTMTWSPPRAAVWRRNPLKYLIPRYDMHSTLRGHFHLRAVANIFINHFSNSRMSSPADWHSYSGGSY